MPKASTFTSYINAELPANLDATWRRYEQLATRTYSNIARSAESASRRTAGLVGGRGTGGTGAGSASGLGRQAAQMRALDDMNRKVSASTADLTGKVTRQGKAMNDSASASNKAAKSLAAVSTSLNIVQGPLGPIAGRVRALSTALTELTGFRLGIAGIASSLFVLGSVGNDYAQLQARLRGTFVDQSRVNRAMADIAGIARASRTALDPVADTYIRISKAAEQFGISQERARKITETVTKAAILSGGPKASQEAGIYQFGQAFGSGNLGGDELRSVKENTFVLAQAIAQGLGTTIGGLKALAQQGKLTSEEIATALEKSSREIDARFEAMPKTTSQGISELRNSFTLLVGSFDQSVGFTSKLAGALDALAGSLRFLASAAVGVGTAFAVIKTAAFAKDLQTSIVHSRTMSSALQQLAQRRLVQAQSDVEGAQRSIAALRGYEAELNAVMELETRRANLAIRDQTRADTNAGMRAAIAEERNALLALAAARSDARVTADALAAAEARLAAAEVRVAEAQAVASARSRGFGTAIKNLIGAINPLGIAIAVATTAIITLATRTSETERVLESFSDETVDAAKKAIGLANANGALANSYYAIARAMGRKAVAEARESQEKVGGETAGTLRELATRAFSGVGMGRASAAERAQVGTQLQNLARDAAKGNANAGQLLETLDKLGKKYKGLIPEDEPLGGIFSKIGLASPVSSGAVDDRLTALYLAQQKLNNAEKDQAQIEKDIAESQRQIASAKPAGGGAVSVATLKAGAQADAIDSGTSAIRAAGIRRKNALIELDKEMGVAQGKVPGEKAAEYRQRAAEIERAYNAEVEGARAAAKARTAAAKEARQEAAQAIRDNTEEAKSKLALSLLDLEKRKPTLTQEEYYQARLKLLRTYDEEIEKADAAGVHTSSAVEQQIRDIRELQKAAEAAGEKRRDMLAGWDEAPKALDRARDQIDDLQRLVGKAVDGVVGKTADNPLGTGVYTADMAQADAQHILDGVRRPLEEAADQAERLQQTSALRLHGYDLEATALERALGLQDEIGRLSREDFNAIVDQVDAEQRVNAALEQRQRLLEPIIASVQQTKDAFEQLLVDGPKGLAEFGKTIKREVRQIFARQVTEALFGGAEQKLRDLLGGQRKGVDAAYEFLAQHARSTGDEFDNVATSGQRAADALTQLANAADAAAGGVGGGTIGGSPENAVKAAINSLGGAAAVAAVAAGAAGGSLGGLADQPAGTDRNQIVVTATRVAQVLPRIASEHGTGLGLGTSFKGLKALGDTFGGQLNKIFGTTFFKKMGNAFEGAGYGMAASGIAGALGLKQSNTGAAIGGALGGLIPGLGPLGGVIGGLVGGTLGGMLKKAKYGTAGISVDAYGNVSGASGAGHGKQEIAGAGAAAGSVAQALNQISQALGATITGTPNLTIGTYNGKARVSTSGRTGKLKAKYGDVQDFGKGGEDAAIEFAIRYTIEHAAITGISQASRNILKSGQDLQAAIEKAVAIEAIPKKLLALKDPVRAAVSDLNDEFSRLIGYLKEGGATAEQFAQARELYDLQRADAIKQATQQAVGAIEDFMAQMTAGPSSPLNKLTVYQNAGTTLETLKAQINAGKVVDQNELTSAASNFQDASRNLYGSSQQFFDDFHMLYDLLGKARDNALAGGTDAAGNPTLPASPFEADSTVKALLDRYNNVGTAVDQQTNVLASLLTDIRDTLAGAGTAGTIPSSIASLPGWKIAADPGQIERIIPR